MDVRGKVRQERLRKLSWSWRGRGEVKIAHAPLHNKRLTSLTAWL